MILIYLLDKHINHNSIAFELDATSPLFITCKLYNSRNSELLSITK